MSDQAQNQPEGARCSDHPGGSGGGAVYVDLSISEKWSSRIFKLAEPGLNAGERKVERSKA